MKYPTHQSTNDKTTAAMHPPMMATPMTNPRAVKDESGVVLGELVLDVADMARVVSAAGMLRSALRCASCVDSSWEVVFVNMVVRAVGILDEKVAEDIVIQYVWVIVGESVCLCGRLI
jgi:hypothetical protein